MANHAPPTMPERHIESAPPGEAIAPATGSLPRGWLAVALRPTRRTFAAWAPMMTRKRVVLSLAVGLLLSAVSTVVAGIWPQWVTITIAGPGEQVGALTQGGSQVGTLVSYSTRPLAYLGEVLAVAAAWAVLMPARLGPPRTRFERALEPWALAQPALQAWSLIVQAAIIALNVIFAVALGTGPIQLTMPYDLRLLTGVVSMGLIAAVLAIGLTAYFIAVLVRAGRVGSGLGGWPAFGAAVAGYAAAGLLIAALNETIGAVAVAAGAP